MTLDRQLVKERLNDYGRMDGEFITRSRRQFGWRNHCKEKHGTHQSPARQEKAKKRKNGRFSRAKWPKSWPVNVIHVVAHLRFLVDNTRSLTDTGTKCFFLFVSIPTNMCVFKSDNFLSYLPPSARHNWLLQFEQFNFNSQIQEIRIDFASNQATKSGPFWTEQRWHMLRTLRIMSEGTWKTNHEARGRFTATRTSTVTRLLPV